MIASPVMQISIHVKCYNRETYVASELRHKHTVKVNQSGRVIIEFMSISIIFRIIQEGMLLL